ncbi:MAG: hypothetical protein BIFFINMI_01370 [Phycisphaerae bacterium]|nr:hypothetical protein [Phycisphaerae bacterium]
MGAGLSHEGKRTQLAELLGICGADEATASRVLARMEAHVREGAAFRIDRHAGPGFGLLRCHHGVINPQPQPVRVERLAAAGGDLLVGMDGELLDGGELRRRLEEEGRPFEHDGCDAELAGRVLAARGSAGLAELRGSFSLAVWEPVAGRLTLAVDRSFSRPIYWCRMGDALVFASRFNALVACGALDGGELDMLALYTTFMFDDLHDTMTYYRQAQALIPGGLLTFQAGRVTLDRYWRPRYGGPRVGLDAAAEELAAALVRAGRRATADRPRKGLMLSGGLDSRTMLAVAEGPLHTFTTTDFYNSEARIAARLARTRGSEHTWIPRDPDHYAHIVDAGVELSGGMGRFHHAIFAGLAGRIARSCDVAFTEEPADRMFKGFYWDRRLLVAGLRVPLPGRTRPKREGIVEQILRLEVKGQHHNRPWMLFREPWRTRFLEELRSSIERQLADAGTDDPRHLIEHVAGQRCPGRIASFQNVSCVRTHLEYRSLFLDDELRELSLRMSPRWRLGAAAMRRALRRIDPRLFAIADANTGVRPDAPAPIAWACEMAADAGFLLARRMGLHAGHQTNKSWSDRAGASRRPALAAMLAETLGDPACIEPSIFDTDQVADALRQQQSGSRGKTALLMTLLTFGRWFRRFGPGR